MVEALDFETPGQSKFEHPISRDLVEFPETLLPEERMRLISDASTLHLDFERGRFVAFFPDSISPKPFKVESVDHPPEAGLTHEQREVRRELLAYLGYRSPSKKELKEIGDIPELHVAFTNRHDAIVTMMNGLPSVRRMQGIAQTEPNLMLTPTSQLEEINLEKYSLWQHVNHLGYSFAQTNIRLAMNDPWLYIERISKDINEFEYQYEKRYGQKIKFTLEPTAEVKQLVERVLEDSSLPAEEKNNFALRMALQSAMEWGKYYEIYTKLHDVESPALKDVFMKIQARTEGQRSVSFSEDDALIVSIDRYIDHQLAPIIKRHGLQKELVRVVVASLASENSPTLGGYLIKDKRKDLQKREDYAGIPQGASFDLDQESGTTINMAFLANAFLPGGFKHKDKSMLEPIGSFDERMRLLTYAMVTRMGRERLTETLQQLQIDPSRVYISAEELSVWSNMILKQVPLGEGDDASTEIMPVSLSAGDVKRGISCQNLLYTFYYFGGQRTTSEIFTQDPIAFVLGSGRLPEEAFEYRSDLEISWLLSRISKAFSMVLEDRELYAGALILSEDELSALAGASGELDNVLVSPIKSFPDPILKKNGTMVQDEEGNILPYLEIVRQKKDRRIQGDLTVHPDSLNARQAAVTEVVGSQQWYLAIQLDETKQQQMASLLSDHPRDPVRQALHFWTEPITLKTKIIYPTLRKEFFPKYSVNVGSSE